MSIDWVTVAAQLVNFLVLVWLLKRFLYRPILDGIDARESEIADRMSEASHIKQSAETTVADYQHRLQTLQQDRTTTLEQARQEAQADRDAMLDETRNRIRQEQAAAKRQQQRQASEYITQLHQMSATAILEVVNKALSDLSDETLEERLVMHALTSLKKQHSASQAEADQQTVALILTSHNVMDDAARQRIQASADTLWSGCNIEFRHDDQQAPGALVQFGSSQVEWTVDAYVKELEAQLHRQLESGGNKSGQLSDSDNRPEPMQASEELTS